MEEAAEPAKSEYELLRERNIARNKAVMLALGLIDDDVTLHKAARATKKAKPAAAKKRKAAAEPREGSRRSKRVQGQTPEGAAGADEAAVARPEEDDDDVDDSRHEEARAAHEARWSGQQRRATIVGTASYAHTLMRVRTMSEAALWTRMKKIEQAKGQHAVTKMRLFARVCFLEEYFDLADACTEALARLVAALGDPCEDEVVETPAAA